MTCGECKHWRFVVESAEGKARGICMNEGTRLHYKIFAHAPLDYVEKKEILEFYYHVEDNTDVYFSENFGCIFWEAKR
jgi:hypothetical protein